MTQMRVDLLRSHRLDRASTLRNQKVISGATLFVVTLLLATLFPNSQFVRGPFQANRAKPETIIDSWPTLSAASSTDLPMTGITISLYGGPFGNHVNATLTFGFRPALSDDSLSLGFSQEFLQISSGPSSLSAIGLGYDEMREYPFFYTDDGMLFDYRFTPAPNWVSRRYYAAWTELDRWEGFLGPISPENMSRATLIGDIVQFENLTIYFEDSTAFICGPQTITIGAKFTHSNDSWSVEHIVNASDYQGIVVEPQSLSISLRSFEPPSLVFYGSLIVLPLLLIGLVRRVRTRSTR
jgi:hypothetical protein